MEYYSKSLQHILAELERLDLFVQVQVARARNDHKTDKEFEGLFIPEQEVDALLSQPIGMPRWATAHSYLPLGKVQTNLNQINSKIAARIKESIKRGVELRLEKLASLFRLTAFDIDTILICLAPELDLRYGRLYAYLQDDVTKKRPSVDLVLNLLCSSFEEKIISRHRFSLKSPLLKHHLVNIFNDPSQYKEPFLGNFLRVDDRVVNYLLEYDEIDSRISAFCNNIIPKTKMQELIIAEDVKRKSIILSREKVKSGNGLVFYFQGTYGVGKQSAAEAICKELGLGLLTVHIDRLMKSADIGFREGLQLLCREALLQSNAIYLHNFDQILAEDKPALLEDFIQELECRQMLIFLAGNRVWEPLNALHNLTFVRIEFQRPDVGERMRLWTKSLNGSVEELDQSELESLISKFRFSGGQIKDAATTARNIAQWRNPVDNQVTISDLYKACRLQSNRKLTTLAQKITPHYKWDDIVMPIDRLKQLKEICNYVKYRSLVYDKWGFESKLSMGKGLNILFVGPSGTGKTMASDIMAGELGLDLYKIDLSTVVSKYIGETEKNLARIFTEASTSNSILFFDEADALFGKRSEVRDSHDRYANIEISYLLQKMEEYDGVVILATNLRKNMDDAFVRRMHFTIDFIFPAEKDRKKIWEQIWPENTPKSENIDLDFMATRFQLAGGNIRNIALSAAFMAADDGGVVKMDHIIQALQREYQKMGKVIIDGEFGDYKN